LIEVENLNVQERAIIMAKQVIGQIIVLNLKSLDLAIVVQVLNQNLKPSWFLIQFFPKEPIGINLSDIQSDTHYKTIDPTI
jgi:hypothetical protein